MQMTGSAAESGNERRKRKLFGSMPLWCDMLLCVGITFSCSMFSFESTIDEAFMKYVRVIAGVLMLLNWFRTIYMSGREHKIGAVIFAVLYWTVPTAVSLISDAYSAYGTSFYSYGEIGRVLTAYPFSNAAGFIGTAEWPFDIAMAVLLTIVYKLAPLFVKTSDDE